MIRLIILSSQLEDSAIYFCCLREMNTKKKKIHVIKELNKNLITQLEQLPVPIFAEKTYKSYPYVLLEADG